MTSDDFRYWNGLVNFGLKERPYPVRHLYFNCCSFFCKHPNRIFTKSDLYERVWGSEAISDDNTVMVHIHRIRERIESDPSNPVFLVNVRGLGYKLILPEHLSRP